MSFWLSLDPATDLEPGFCDPIQMRTWASNFWALGADGVCRWCDNRYGCQDGCSQSINVWRGNHLESPCSRVQGMYVNIIAGASWLLPRVNEPVSSASHSQAKGRKWKKRPPTEVDGRLEGRNADATAIHPPQFPSRSRRSVVLTTPSPSRSAGQSPFGACNDIERSDELDA